MPGGKKHGKKQAKPRLTNWVSTRTNYGTRTSTDLRRCTYVAALTTTGASVLGFNMGSTLLRSNANEWTNLSARYTEYRIRGIRVHVIRTDSSFSTAALPASAQLYTLIGTDRSGILASPTTAQAVWGLSGTKVFQVPQTTKPAAYSEKALDLEEQNFTAVTVNSTTFQVQLFLQSNTASLIVGSLFVEWDVEFRGAQ